MGSEQRRVSHCTYPAAGVTLRGGKAFWEWADGETAVHRGVCIEGSCIEGSGLAIQHTCIEGSGLAIQHRPTRLSTWPDPFA